MACLQSHHKVKYRFISLLCLLTQRHLCILWRNVPLNDMGFDYLQSVQMRHDGVIFLLCSTPSSLQLLCSLYFPETGILFRSLAFVNVPYADKPTNQNGEDATYVGLITDKALSVTHVRKQRTIKKRSVKTLSRTFFILFHLCQLRREQRSWYIRHSI